MHLLKRLRLATVGIALLFPAGAFAQGWAVSDEYLIEPWTRAKAVVMALPDRVDIAKRAQIDAQLDTLYAQIAALQALEEEVAIKIVTVPEFGYDAALTSDAMANHIAQIESSFAAVFESLGVQERADTMSVQESLRSLRQRLDDAYHFERDVIRALGSGSRHEIQTLAGRWWTGAQSAGGVKDAIAMVRAQLANPTANGQQR
jgi:hypothetical protein